MKTFSFRPALDFRGRKFKGLRGFAGKPSHPPLTDVTVGAYVLGPLLEVVSYLFKSDAWASDAHRAASMILLVGAVSSIATMLTGFADWLNTQKGTQMRRMVNAHAWTMIVTTLLVVANLAYKYLGDHYGSPDLFGVVLSAATVVLVTAGGTIGGSLTYDYGFNVETATDNHVWHVSEHDILHPHDDPPKDGSP